MMSLGKVPFKFERQHLCVQEYIPNVRVCGKRDLPTGSSWFNSSLLLKEIKPVHVPNVIFFKSKVLELSTLAES